MYSLKEEFKSIQIIFMALLAGMLMFAGVTTFVLVEETFYQVDFNDFFTILVLALGFVSIILSGFFYKLITSRIEESHSLPEKVNKYKTAKIVSLAIAEMPILFSIVSFMFTGNTFFQLVFFVLLAFFITKVPGKVKFIEDAKISREESVNF